MKKKISRFVSLILCTGMVMVGLSGCGMSDEKLLEKGIAAINDAKSYEMEGSYDGTLSLIEGDAPATDVKMSMSLSETVFREPLRAKLTSKIVVETDDATEVTSYVQKENDEYVVYTNTYGAWNKRTLPDSVTALSEAGISACMIQQFSEDKSRYTKKEDRKEGDKSYLVYEYTFSPEEVKRRSTEMIRSWGSNGVTGEMKTTMEEVAQSISDLKATLIFDREAKRLVRVEYPVSELMTKIIRAMLDSMAYNVNEDANEAGTAIDLAEALSQITIEMKDMVLVMTYKNLDNAADFEIPKEVLEAESEVK